MVFFTNNDFALNAAGVLFRIAFPNTHHSDFIDRLLLAEAGDASRVGWLLNFFAGDGKAAAFATGSQSTAIEFTGGVVLIPEPASLGLIGLGLAAMIATGRRRLGRS